MTRNVILALAAAIVFHGMLLLFGGLLFFHEPKQEASVEEIDVLSGPETEEKKDEEKKEAEAAAEEEKAAEAEAELTQQAAALPTIEPTATQTAAPAGPALDAMSLAELEGALAPDVGGGSFAESFSLASGGRIGASGGVAEDEAIADVLTSAELDQRPRAVLTVDPSYPMELRKRKLEATVSVVFLVGTDGKVRNVQVEKSTNPLFDRAALDAVRQWRFEPGTRKGEKVEFKMRQPITFRAS
jgi:protein TonB